MKAANRQQSIRIVLFTHRYTFVIEGTVAVGASNTSLIVRIIDERE